MRGFGSTREIMQVKDSIRVAEHIIATDLAYRERNVSCEPYKGKLRIEFMSGVKVVGIGFYEQSDPNTMVLIGLDISNWIMNGAIDKRIRRCDGT
jgi:hypothetical protein